MPISHIKKLLTPNLPKLCSQNIKFYEYAKENNEEIRDRFSKKCYFQINENLDLSNNTDMLQYEQLLGRMTPIKYYQKDPRLGYNILLQHHLKYLEYFNKNKFFVNQSYNYMSISIDTFFNCAIDEYTHFLNMHIMLSQMCPLWKEQFVWMSHLMDNKSYVENTRNILGKILDHSFDTNYEEHQEKSDKTRAEYYPLISCE